MDILIISTNQSRSPAPVLPAGACIVAEAAASAGHNVSLLDLMFEADPVRKVQAILRRSAFDVIGLSIRNIDNNDMNGTAFYLPQLKPLIAAVRRSSDAFLVLGGAALAVMPEQITGFLEPDCAVVGDGEETFCRLLRQLEATGQADNVAGTVSLRNNRFSAHPAVPARTRCAVPDYRRWIDLRAYRSQMSTLPLQSKLGCAFRCVYCTYRRIEGDGYRLFDPEAVVEQAQRALGSGWRHIEFTDNVFNAPAEHAFGVCEAMIRSGLRARLQSVELNPAGFTDELLTVMERAGFVGIGLTVESASDQVLHGLGKGFTSRDVSRAADTLSRHDLPCVWIFMLGGPGETEDTVRETLRFARERIRPADAAFFNVGVRIYPGTELEAIARRQGVLSAPPGEMLEPVFYVSPLVDPAWIRGQVKAALDLNMNFMSVDTFSFPYLPLVNRIGHFLGIRPPLWRHTARIRRGLRTAGMDV